MKVLGGMNDDRPRFNGAAHWFPQQSAEARYKALCAERQFYLDAAKECCKYTIPSLLCFFEEGAKSWADLRAPYQGIGARGLGNLASKLLTAITPVNTPMFRLIIDDDGLKQKMLARDEGWITEIETGLAAYGKSVLDCIKASGDYAHMYEVWQLLLVSGNVLVADPDDNGNIKVYSLRDYVLKRDRSGNVTEIVIRETVSPDVLPAGTLESMGAREGAPSGKAGFPGRSSGENYELYTRAARKGGFFYTYQECKGAVINGTEGKYPLEACPYIPIRMYAGAGEDYSRSFVSNYLGDLKSIDGLSQGTVEGAAMAAKHIYLVRPDGLTEIKDIEETPNGGVIYGRSDDVQVMQSGKAYDLRIVGEEAGKIEKRLSQAFLLLDGGIRDAERVTREEIKAVASELEASMGGVYSVMCHSFQIPYIKRKIWKLQRLGKIKPLDKRITPVVVTGFEALGMSGDRDSLLEFLSLAGKVLGENAGMYIDGEAFIKRLAASMGIDTAGLLKNRGSLERERLEAAGERLMDKAVPAAINNAEGLQKVIDNMAGCRD